MKFGVAAAAFALAIGQCAGSVDIDTECDAGCRVLLHPSDRDLAKQVNLLVMKDCAAQFKRTNAEGKVCRLNFLEAGETACRMACKGAVSNVNTVANTVEMGIQRQGCLKYSNPFHKQACDVAVAAATKRYTGEGARVRSIAEGICGSPAPEKIVEVKEPVAIAVKKAPVVEKAPPAPVVDEEVGGAVEQDVEESQEYPEVQEVTFVQASEESLEPAPRQLRTNND